MKPLRHAIILGIPLGFFALGLLTLSGYMAFEYVEIKGYFASPTSTASSTYTLTPSATPTDTATPTETYTPTPSSTMTPTSTPTQTPTDTPTSTATPSPTSTPTKKPPSVFIPWKHTNLRPYIQSVTDDSVIIAWQTKDEVIGEVQYGLTDEYGHAISEGKPRHRHAIKLENLESDTKYHYQVLVNGEEIASHLSFQTAKRKGDGPIHFSVFGDTHKNLSVHESIISRLMKLKPSFVLHVGDLVNNGKNPNEWIDFFDVESPLLGSTALFPTLGNHEEESEHYFDLFYLPGVERWYTFTYGDARFISLQVDFDWPDVTPSSKQYKWLESTLASNKHPWLIVFFHRSPYTSEYEGGEERHIRENLTPLFEKYGVDLVLSGHNHNYQRSKANGIYYIVTGGGGGSLSDDIEPDQYLIYHKTTYHLVDIHIDGNTLRGEAMKPNGDIFDTFTVKH